VEESSDVTARGAERKSEKRRDIMTPYQQIALNYFESGRNSAVSSGKEPTKLQADRDTGNGKNTCAFMWVSGTGGKFGELEGRGTLWGREDEDGAPTCLQKWDLRANKRQAKKDPAGWG